MSTPTQRTKKLLSELGWSVRVTEHWNPFGHVRQDLFGFIDLLAINGEETLGVQTTSSPVANRLAKAKAQPDFQRWLDSGNRFVVIGWTKKGKKGKRKTWQPRVVEVNRFGNQWEWPTNEVRQEASEADED